MEQVSNDEVHQIARGRIERIAAHRATPPAQDHIDRAASLLAEWWLAGLRTGFSPDDFDWAADLPSAAYDTVVLVAGRKARTGWLDTGTLPGYDPEAGR